MNAREKFQKGQRVRMTNEGVKAWRPGRRGRPPHAARTGRVVGFSQLGNCVRVLVDGNKRPDAYPPERWERV